MTVVLTYELLEATYKEVTDPYGPGPNVGIVVIKGKPHYVCHGELTEIEEEE